MKLHFYCILVAAVIAWNSTPALGWPHGTPWHSSKHDGRCSCSKRYNPCKNTPAAIIGCPLTNHFRQCNGTVCSLQDCPTDQVWSTIQNSCAVCPAGQNISANGKRCICIEGTRLDVVSRKCVPCPAGSTVRHEHCSCAAPLVLNAPNNTCQACPSGAMRLRKGCACKDRTMIFNVASWSCQPCPGQWVVTGRRKQCKCTGPNQIFSLRAGSCITCPAGTTALSSGSGCTMVM